VEYFESVELFEAPDDVDECGPDQGLLKIFLFLFLLRYFVVEIAVVSELHHYAA
jgi:hypothetical protein